MNPKLLKQECCFSEFEPRRLALKFEPACARHHIGDFGDKSTKSETTNIAGTDQALVQTGKGNVAPGSVVVSEGNYLSPDSVQINAGGRLNTGVDLTNVSGGVTFGTSAEQLAKITDSFAKASSDSSKAITDLLEKVLDNQSANTGDAISKITELAESKQTDGESGKNKIVLYVVAGVLVLVAFIFSKK